MKKYVSVIIAMLENTQITQITQGVGGNTSTPTPQQVAPVKNFRCRKWCFTLNNYTELEFTQLPKTFSGAKYIIGKEVGENNTKHLQGFVAFKNTKAFSKVKKLIPRAHIEKAKGNDRQNYDYCSKDGKFVTNMDFRTFQERLNEQILETEYKDVQWKPFQQQIINILKSPTNPRTIHWFWEPTGNVGKSYLCKYLAMTENVVICEGKKADIFNQVKASLEAEKIPAIILCDIPRTAQQYLNYGAIEQLKNGMMYSGKYEGAQCCFPIPKVICFANHEPDLEAMSADRWSITKIQSDVGDPVGHQIAAE